MYKRQTASSRTEQASSAPAIFAIVRAFLPAGSSSVVSASAASRRLHISALLRAAAIIKSVRPLSSRAFRSSPRSMCRRTELATPVMTASLKKRFTGCDGLFIGAFKCRALQMDRDYIFCLALRPVFGHEKYYCVSSS